MKLFRTMANERYKVLTQENELSKFRQLVEHYLEQYPYAWWVGLDFKDEPVAEDGVKMALGYLNHNARVFDAHLVPFMSREPIYTKKRCSIHCILLSDVYVPINHLRKGWKHGHSYYRLYKHHLGGVEYTFKGHTAVHTRLICPTHKPCRKTRKGHIYCAFDEQREFLF